MALFDKKDRAHMIINVASCMMSRWCYEHHGGVPMHCPCGQPCTKDVAIQIAAQVSDQVEAAVEAGTL